jgi:hypothetical protein
MDIYFFTNIIIICKKNTLIQPAYNTLFIPFRVLGDGFYIYFDITDNNLMITNDLHCTTLKKIV